MNANQSRHHGRQSAGVARLLGPLLAAAAVLTAPVVASAQQEAQAAASKPAARHVVRKAHVEAAGNKRIGVASFYAHRFAGRTMANGKPMRLESDFAASRTLPLGTRARVTNLGTGQVAIVTITDRGPYVGGRIIDLSPRVARQLGITGLARVEVSALALPQADGKLRPVYALADAGKTHGQGLKSAL